MNKQIKIDMPAGVQDGTKLRIKGEGRKGGREGRREGKAGYDDVSAGVQDGQDGAKLRIKGKGR